MAELKSRMDIVNEKVGLNRIKSAAEMAIGKADVKLGNAPSELKKSIQIVQRVENAEKIVSNDKSFSKTKEGAEIVYLNEKMRALLSWLKSKDWRGFNEMQDNPVGGKCPNSKLAREIVKDFGDEKLANKIIQAGWGSNGLEEAIGAMEARRDELKKKREEQKKEFEESKKEIGEYSSQLYLAEQTVVVGINEYEKRLMRLGMTLQGYMQRYIQLSDEKKRLIDKAKSERGLNEHERERLKIILIEIKKKCEEIISKKDELIEEAKMLDSIKERLYDILKASRRIWKNIQNWMKRSKKELNESAAELQPANA